MKARRTWWIAGGWALVALLAALTLLAQREQRALRGERTPALSERLFGPFANLAASVQWARVELALQHGDPALAYARAETALALAPGASQSWIFLAHHFIFERASAAREPELARRSAWVRVGLDTLARGIERASEPAEVVFDRGLVYVYLASLADSDRPWDASASEAWARAEEDFARAARAGHPLAREALERARERH